MATDSPTANVGSEDRRDSVSGEEKYFSQACLLEQPFLKDNEINVKNYISSVIAKIGENIKVRRFIRYQLGE